MCTETLTHTLSKAGGLKGRVCAGCLPTLSSAQAQLEFLLGLKSRCLLCLGPTGLIQASAGSLVSSP